MEGSTATVTPLADIRDTEGKPITFRGTTSYSGDSAARLQGQLVTVSSSRIGTLTISRLSGSGASGTLDVNGAPVEISFQQLTRATVPASKISYVGKDYAGRVNIIVFDDVTGDQYTYGFARKGEDQVGPSRTALLSASPPLWMRSAASTSWPAGWS